MSGHRRFSKLRDQVLAQPGGAEAVAQARATTLQEIRRYELRHTEALSHAEAAGRLEITQSAVSKLEHAEDVSERRPYGATSKPSVHG